MSSTLYAGCSYTNGDGFADLSSDPALWINILHQSPPLCDTKQLVVAQGGASNESIFRNSIKCLLDKMPQYAFIQWTGTPRYEIDLGLELYSTRQSFIVNMPCQSHNLHDVSYPSSYLDSIRDRFLTLPHPHRDIVNLLTYVNIIEKISKFTGTEVFFINGLCPWDQNFFEKIADTLPSNYTNWTRKILHTDTRDDQEIFKLYHKMHQDYDSVGGIKSSKWLNLYHSMKFLKVDTNNDRVHPGPQSNLLYAQTFSKSFNNFLVST